MPDRVRQALPGLVLAMAGLGLFLMFPGTYGMRLGCLAAIQAILAIGYQAVFGRLGLLSLAQGAFFGIGAYTTAIASTRLGLDAAATLPLAILVPTAIAAIVALPVLRLASHYLALATLGLAQLALLVAINAEGVTGGAIGINNVPGLAALGFALPRGDLTGMLVTAWAGVAIVAILSWGLFGGRRGRQMDLVHEDPIAAEALGIDGGRLRFQAFLFSAAAAGLAGALNAHLLGIVSPEAHEFPVMVACLSMVVIGGKARIAGAVFGAVLLVLLPEFLRIAGAWCLALHGAAMLAMIVLAPQGTAGLVEAALDRVLPPGRRRLPDPAAPPAHARVIGGKPILTLRGVTKRFGGVTALDRVDLKLMPGELVGLIGPNGSGKTTVINVAQGLYRPDEGQVRFDGADQAGRQAWRIARAGLARGFQSPRLMDDRSVIANVALAAGEGRDAERHAMFILARLGLDAFALRPAGDLPGGVRRKVEIARALMTSPRLLLLDEPAAGLTPAEQAELAALLTELNREGLAILVVEHAVSFLRALTPRLVCLVEGRVVADGPAERVIADPRVIDAYLGRSAVFAGGGPEKRRPR